MPRPAQSEDIIQFKRRCYLFAHDPARTVDETTDALNIGGYIYVRRRELGWSQTALRRLIPDAGRDAINMWENERASPGLRHLPALAAVLEPAGHGLLHSILAYQPPPERRS